jgi:hypothetical protein
VASCAVAKSTRTFILELPARIRTMIGPVTERTRALLAGFFGVPVRQQTYLNLLYLALAFPFGLAYFVFVAVGVSLGVGLSIVLVGIPILAAVLVVGLAIARFEIALANALLGTDLDARPFPEGSLRERATAVATDRQTYTPLVYLPTKLAFGTVAFTVVTSAITTGVSMLFVPLYYQDPALYVGVVTDRPVELHPTLYVAWNKLLVGFETVITLEAWRVGTLEHALVVAAVGVLLVLLSLHVMNRLARVAAWWTRVTLDDAYDVLDVIT